MQDIFTRDDIDAVIIATSDRWHGTAAIRAANAGKDIYCEKPCAMSIEESAQVDEAVRANNRIYQAGMQRRNVDNFVLATELARDGSLGQLKELHAGIWLPQPVLPNLPGEPEPDPSECDWNRWLGKRRRLAGARLLSGSLRGRGGMGRSRRQRRNRLQ